MELTVSIKSSQTISLDSNIFIRSLDDKSYLGDQARVLIKQIIDIKPAVFISTILLEEFFVKIFKKKKDKDLDNIMGFLKLGGIVTILDMTVDIAILAAKIRAKYNIKAPDAIHLASAISSGADIFITTDRKIPRKVEGLKVVVIQKETNF